MRKKIVQSHNIKGSEQTLDNQSI